jgi:hypothetical protein
MHGLRKKALSEGRGFSKIIVHPSAAGYAVMTPHTEQALQAAMAANTP